MSLHYLGKHKPQKLSFMLYTVPRKNEMARREKYLHTSLNNTTLLSPKILKLVNECRRYSKPKQCSFRDTVYSMTEKTICGVYVHVSPGSAETLVRKGGITNSLLCQQHLCQKFPKWVDVRWSSSVQHQCRLFETQCMCIYMITVAVVVR